MSTDQLTASLQPNYPTGTQGNKIPRIEVSDCKRDDIQEPGVYFLFCKEEGNDEDSVYIGEAENVKDRLLQHLRDVATEK